MVFQRGESDPRIPQHLLRKDLPGSIALSAQLLFPGECHGNFSGTTESQTFLKFLIARAQEIKRALHLTDTEA